MKELKEVVSIKTDGKDVFVELDTEKVLNLTQIIAELEIIKFHLINEYHKEARKY